MQTITAHVSLVIIDCTIFELVFIFVAIALANNLHVDVFAFQEETSKGHKTSF